MSDKKFLCVGIFEKSLLKTQDPVHNVLKSICKYDYKILAVVETKAVVEFVSSKYAESVANSLNRLSNENYNLFSFSMNSYETKELMRSENFIELSKLNGFSTKPQTNFANISSLGSNFMPGEIDSLQNKYHHSAVADSFPINAIETEFNEYELKSVLEKSDKKFIQNHKLNIELHFSNNRETNLSQSSLISSKRKEDLSSVQQSSIDEENDLRNCIKISSPLRNYAYIETSENELSKKDAKYSTLNDRKEIKSISRKLFEVKSNDIISSTNKNFSTLIDIDSNEQTTISNENVKETTTNSIVNDLDEKYLLNAAGEESNSQNYEKYMSVFSYPEADGNSFVSNRDLQNSQSVRRKTDLIINTADYNDSGLNSKENENKSFLVPITEEDSECVSLNLSEESIDNEDTSSKFYRSPSYKCAINSGYKKELRESNEDDQSYGEQYKSPIRRNASYEIAIKSGHKSKNKSSNSTASSMNTDDPSLPRGIATVIYRSSPENSSENIVQDCFRGCINFQFY